MNETVITYTTYILISVAMTVWVARTLQRNGRVFLIKSFGNNVELADSINHLLVVGFYLINAGFIALFLKAERMPVGAAGIIELLATKLGVVFLVLAVMHFFNLFVFHRIYRHNEIRDTPPPIQPEAWRATSNPAPTEQ